MNELPGSREGGGWVMWRMTSPTVTDFKRRYLIASGSNITCFKDEKKKKTFATITLSKGFGARIVHGHEKQNVVSLTATDGQQWEVCCYSAHERDFWMEVLNSKMIIANTQNKKLDNNSNTPSSSPITTTPTTPITTTTSTSTIITNNPTTSTAQVTASGTGLNSIVSPRSSYVQSSSSSPMRSSYRSSSPHSLYRSPVTSSGHLATSNSLTNLPPNPPSHNASDLMSPRSRTGLMSPTTASQTAVPKGFPPPPAFCPSLPSTYTVEEYKMYMRQKRQQEIWENGLRIFLEKERVGDKTGMARLVEQLNKELDVPSQEPIDDDDIPPEFPPAPPQVGKYHGNDQASYQAHMRRKLIREQWENYLLSYKQKAKINDRAAMSRILEGIKQILAETSTVEAGGGVSTTDRQVTTTASLPKGFPPQPEQPGKFVGFLVTDREAYKEHMRKKLKYQTWETSLQNYRKKEQEGARREVLEGIIQRLKIDLEAITPCRRELDISSLPPGFPPPPPKIQQLFKCTSEQEYKEYMLAKYVRDTWEDALILYRQKQQQNDKEGMEKIIRRLNQQQNQAEQEKKRPVKQRNLYRSSLSCPSPETASLTNKLYNMEQLLSPKDLNTDASFQTQVLLLLQDLMRLQQTQPQLWRETETELFEGLKQHLDGQLRHIFVNFLHYCENLDSVDLKMLLKILESLKGRASAITVLTESFQHAARTTYILHTETASDNENTSRTVKLIQVIKMVLTTVNDDLERTTRSFKDYVDPAVVSIEIFNGLLSKETTLLCSVADSDPIEMFSLYKTYVHAVRSFEERVPNLQCPALDNNVFDKWILDWIQLVQTKLSSIMDRAIENDKWEPFSNRALFSIGVLTLQDCIRQNLDSIREVQHNEHTNLIRFAMVACNLATYYLSRLKDTFIATSNNHAQINAWNLLKLEPPALKFFEQSNPHINLTIVPALCTQLNNCYGVQLVFNQFQKEIHSLMKKPSSNTKQQYENTSIRQVDNDVFHPFWSSQEGIKNSIIQHATTGMMLVDVQQALKWVTLCQSNNRNEPLFIYLDAQLSELNAKLEPNLFLDFLKQLLVMLVNEIDRQLELLGEQNFLTLFSKQQNSMVTSKYLAELLQETSVWIHADGKGLPEDVIEGTVRDTRFRLEFWCNAPTTLVIETINNWDESLVITKRQLLRILQTRNDPESKEFISKNGGGVVAASPVAVAPIPAVGGGSGGGANFVFGRSEQTVTSGGGTGGSPTSLFGVLGVGGQKKEEVKEQEGNVFFSAIYDWFQN